MFAFLRSYFQDPWPDAKPLPPHVANLKLDSMMLALHLANAHKPSDRTVTGFQKPTKADK